MAVPPPGPPQAQSRLGQFVAQYLAPAAFASIVGVGLSVYTALNAQQKAQRDFSQSFENLVTATPIMAAFKGGDAAEQQATATLLALQSVADTTAQKQTVLLLGARMLNANTDSELTGGPAARLLTILIDEDEAAGDRRLSALTHSRPFLDLVTAGYSNDYYNDDPKRDWYTWPTLNGDEPITAGAKLSLLQKMTAPSFDGWVHLASFSTDYRFSNKPVQTAATAPPTPAPTATKAPAQLETQPLVLSKKTALNFVDALTEVVIRRDMGHAKDIVAQYAVTSPEDGTQPTPAPVASPTAVPTSAPLFTPTAMMDRSQVPVSLLMLKPRLLRERPPVEYVNPDGSFHKGSLGGVIGAVPAGTCIKVVDPLRPILVFVTTPLSDRIPGAAKDQWIGLIHMWAHVQPSHGCTSPTTSHTGSNV